MSGREAISNSGVPTLEFRTTEIFEDLFPVRRILVSAQIGLELAAENLQGRALANTVRADKSQHLAGPGHGQPMQLEAVGRVPVCDLGLEIGWKIDDVYGAKRALLDTDTTSNAQTLGNESNLGFRGDLYAQFPRPDDGTGLLAFLSAFLDEL